MAKVVFKSYNPNDNLLLPPCLGDYLPQNHPARVVSVLKMPKKIRSSHPRKWPAGLTVS